MLRQRGRVSGSPQRVRVLRKSLPVAGHGAAGSLRDERPATPSCEAGAVIGVRRHRPQPARSESAAGPAAGRQIVVSSFVDDSRLQGALGTGFTVLDKLAADTRVIITDRCATARVAALRDALPDAGLIIVGADNVADHVEALGAGADIYLARPVATIPLVAHIRALVRRQDVSGAARPQ